MEETVADAELTECAHEVCPMPAVAKVGDLPVCVGHFIWAAERLRPGQQAIPEVLPQANLPVTERTYPPGVGPGWVD